MGPENDEELVAVYQAANSGEAYLLISILEAAEVPAVLMGERSAWAGHSGLSNPANYAQIAVPTRFADKARQVLEANQSEVEADEPEPTVDDRHTVNGWKGACWFGTAVSLAAAAVVWACGLGNWMVLGGPVPLAMAIYAPGHYRTAPPRFHPVMNLWRQAHWLLGVAFVVGWVGYLYDLQWSLPVAEAMCLFSAGLFVHAALTPISPEER